MNQQATKYVVHLTEEQLGELIDTIIIKRTQLLLDEIKELGDQKNFELLQIEDVMSLLKDSKKTVRNWMQKKTIPCLWMGGMLYFRRKDIIESMQRNI